MTDIIHSSETGGSEAEAGDEIIITDDPWVVVCAADLVQPDRGIAALVGAEAVAIFRLSPVDDGDDEWCAVSHVDPASGVPVMARGLVGSVGNGPIVIPTVASPLHKQRYNLRSGYCLDDRELRLAVHDVRVVDGRVECRLRP